MKSKHFLVVTLLVIIMIMLMTSSHVPAETVSADNAYIGSKACGQCHESEFKSYILFAKKAKSWEHVSKMQGKLTAKEFTGCFECHTTGYGKPGGFVSESETPHLKEPGCEVCHGPGQRHADTENKQFIKSVLDVKDCEACHDETRVKAFNFKPLVHGGAH